MLILVIISFKLPPPPPSPQFPSIFNGSGSKWKESHYYSAIDTDLPVHFASIQFLVLFSFQCQRGISVFNFKMQWDDPVYVSVDLRSLAIELSQLGREGCYH